jgi:hypothetical protein
VTLLLLKVCKTAAAAEFHYSIKFQDVVGRTREEERKVGEPYYSGRLPFFAHPSYQAALPLAACQ